MHSQLNLSISCKNINKVFKENSGLCPITNEEKVTRLFKEFLQYSNETHIELNLYSRRNEFCKINISMRRKIPQSFLETTIPCNLESLTNIGGRLTDYIYISPTSDRSFSISYRVQGEGESLKKKLICLVENHYEKACQKQNRNERYTNHLIPAKKIDYVFVLIVSLFSLISILNLQRQFYFKQA